MASVAKVTGGGAAVLGGGSAVGYGVKYALEMEPNSTVLALATNFGETYTSGKLGAIEANKNVFVDPDRNEKWWNWVNENLLKVDKDSQDNEIYADFLSVTKGYATGNDTGALNQVCKTAFKKESKTVVNIKYKKNIWKYCSKDRNNLEKHEVPPTFYYLDSDKNESQKISETTKLGGVEKNKKKLVADISDNEEGWNWIYENKLKDDIANATKKAAMDASFSKITSGYSSGDSETALNKVCKKTYDKQKSDLEGSDSKLKKNAGSYCTKEGTENSLDLPS